VDCGWGYVYGKDIEAKGCSDEDGVIALQSIIGVSKL
jgi:hypothetical protein